MRTIFFATINKKVLLCDSWINSGADLSSLPVGVTFHTESGAVIICVMSGRRSRSTNDMLSAYYSVCQASRSQEASLFFITYFCAPFYLHFSVSSLTLTNDQLRMSPSHRDLHLISFPIPHCLNPRSRPIYVTRSHRL